MNDNTLVQLILLTFFHNLRANFLKGKFVIFNVIRDSHRIRIFFPIYNCVLFSYCYKDARKLKRPSSRSFTCSEYLFNLFK